MLKECSLLMVTVYFFLCLFICQILQEIFIVIIVLHYMYFVYIIKKLSSFLYAELC